MNRHPFSSSITVIRRPAASVVEADARARLRPPERAELLEDTLTDELLEALPLELALELATRRPGPRRSARARTWSVIISLVQGPVRIGASPDSAVDSATASRMICAIDKRLLP